MIERFFGLWFKFISRTFSWVFMRNNTSLKRSPSRPRVKKRVSERVLQRGMHIIRSETVGRRLASAQSFATRVSPKVTPRVSARLLVKLSARLLARLFALAKRLPIVLDRIICTTFCKTLSETRFFTRGVSTIKFIGKPPVKQEKLKENIPKIAFDSLVFFIVYVPLRFIPSLFISSRLTLGGQCDHTRKGCKTAPSSSSSSSWPVQLRKRSGSPRTNPVARCTCPKLQQETERDDKL